MARSTASRGAPETAVRRGLTWRRRCRNASPGRCESTCSLPAPAQSPLDPRRGDRRRPRGDAGRRRRGRGRHGARSRGCSGRPPRKLEATVKLRMAHIPTSVCHLFGSRHPSAPELPGREGARRGLNDPAAPGDRDGRGAARLPAIEDTVELDTAAPHDFDLLPTSLIPERLNDVTGADPGDGCPCSSTTSTRKRRPAPPHLARLAARPDDRAPLGHRPDDRLVAGPRPLLQDRASSRRTTRRCSRSSSGVKAHHPDKTLAGYQGGATAGSSRSRPSTTRCSDEVNVTYVNSTLAFSPDDTTAVQRVRLSARSARDAGAANCIDGVVLLASLLEAILAATRRSSSSPGHAFLGWETWRDSGEWRYLETTMLGGRSRSRPRRRAATTRRPSSRKLAADRNDQGDLPALAAPAATARSSASCRPSRPTLGAERLHGRLRTDGLAAARAD